VRTPLSTSAFADSESVMLVVPSDHGFEIDRMLETVGKAALGLDVQMFSVKPAPPATGAPA